METEAFIQESSSVAFLVYGRGHDPNSEFLKDYHISDMESTGNPSVPNPHYFGYVNKDCNWYIMKVTNVTTRYARGSGDYDANWDDRASHTYHNFQDIF